MRGNDDCTLFHIACQYGHYDTASMLLEAGTDPNSRDACGRTPLQVAHAHGNVKIMNCSRFIILKLMMTMATCYYWAKYKAQRNNGSEENS